MKKALKIPQRILAMLLIGISISCGSAPTIVQSVQMAKDVNPTTNEPINVTDVYDSTDRTLHCVVKVTSASTDTKLRARWIVINANGIPTNFKIGDTDVTAEKASPTIDFKFTAKEGKSWPSGDYKVEIYLNPDTEKGKTPAKEVLFSVKGGTAPATTPESMATPKPAE